MSGSAESPTPPPLRCVLWHAPGAHLPGDLLTSLSRRIGHITVCTDAYAAMAEVCQLERARLAAVNDPSAAARPGTVLLLVQPSPPAQLAEAGEVVTELRVYAPAALCWKYDAGANPRLSAVVESDVTAWTARGATAGAGAEAGLLSGPRTTQPSQQQPLSSGSSSPFTPAQTPRRAPAATPSESQRAAPAAAHEPRLRLAGDEDVAPPARITVRPGTPTPARPMRPQRPLQLRGEGPHEPPVAPARAMLTPEEMRMLLGEEPPANGAGRPAGPEGRG